MEEESSGITLRIKLLFLIFVVILPNFSLAFCPDPMPSVQTKLTRSQVAFIGKVVSVKNIVEIEDGEDFITGRYYTMKTIKVFRGPQKKFIEVYEDNDSGRMGLAKDHIYLIFIGGNKYQRVEKGSGAKKRLHGWCDDAREVPEKDVEKNISRMEEIVNKVASGWNGDIRGYVESGSGGSSSGEDALPGIHFVVEGNGKDYKIVSDKGGWIHASVPPGHYNVKCVEPNVQLKCTIYSPDNSNDIEVKAGGGADLEFTTRDVP